MTLAELTSAQAPAWGEDLQTVIRKELLESQKTIVVLDDDPTGTQTVFDLPVLTRWSPEILQEEFENETPVFYLLTNSRALTAEQTKALHLEIGRNLAQAAEAARRKFVIISRSDSTLRGHFPLECDTLAEALNWQAPLTFFVPFFQAGGRLTVEGQHYVVENGEAIPAHETPFAQDNAFPFSHSYLPDYLAEKSGGRISPEKVCHLSLSLLRSGGPEQVLSTLRGLAAGSCVIVDALELRDLEVLTSVLPRIEAERPVLYRTAASFVQARAGMPGRELLSKQELSAPDNGHGGLIVVGSHVPKTTAQLEHLSLNSPVEVLELSVPQLLADPDEVLFPLSRDLNEHLQAGQTVVLATSRERVDAPNEAANLMLSQTISRALVALVQSLKDKPRFLIAKGGITSSDVATDALGVKRAMVLGQILPGVPVWSLGPETRFPGLPYVIFPGNVGDDDALTLALQKLIL